MLPAFTVRNAQIQLTVRHCLPSIKFCKCTELHSAPARYRRKPPRGAGRLQLATLRLSPSPLPAPALPVPLASLPVSCLGPAASPGKPLESGPRSQSKNKFRLRCQLRVRRRTHAALRRQKDTGPKLSGTSTLL